MSIAFSISSLTNRGAFLRLEFTKSPLLVSHINANDGLNLSNYSLSGTFINNIVDAHPVGGNPNQVDLYLGSPLSAGQWTLTVSGVQASDGDPLVAPFSITIVITQTVPLAAMGAVNDSPETVLRKHLTPAIGGNATNALIAAIATGDQTNWDNAQKAFKQLYLTTASGTFLERLAADNGINKPGAVGIGDDYFRKLAIKVSASKLTQDVILEVLEVFYGPDAVRASLTTVPSEPYSLQDGQVLSLLTEESIVVNVPFLLGDFVDITKAKAQEVAAAITRSCSNAGSKAYAVVTKDPATAIARVRIYSGALGLKSAIRVTGGQAQNSLNFPTLIQTAESGKSWSVSIPSAGVARFTTSGTTVVDLSQVQIGDYVNIYGAAFSASNIGSFPVTNVSVTAAGSKTQYFEVKLNTPAIQTVTLLSANDIIFYRPKKASVSDAGRAASLVSQSAPTQVDIVMPATTRAVSRTLKTGAYGQPGTSIALDTGQGLQRSSTGETFVFTQNPHGLSVGNQVRLQNVKTYKPPLLPSAGGAGFSDYSPASCMVNLIDPSATGTSHGTATTLADGGILWYGGLNTVATTPPYNYIHTGRRLTISAPLVNFDGSKRYPYAWTDTVFGGVNKAFHAASLLISGPNINHVLITGGQQSSGSFLNDIVRFNPNNNQLQTVVGALIAFRAAHTQVTLQNGRVLIAGGIVTGPVTSATCELYIPENDGSISTGAMSGARAFHTASLLNDGRVLVTGGAVSTSEPLLGTPDSMLNSCELFDGTSAWSRTAPMNFYRFKHAAVLLPDGRVLVCGGVGAKANTAAPSVGAALDQSSAEIWDPQTGTWSHAGYMAYPRSGHSAFYIASINKVVVVGGSLDGNSKCEYYDVATGRWTRSLASPTAFNKYGAAAATRDVVLYVGGAYTDQIRVDSSPQLFIPNSDAFSAGGLNGEFSVARIVTPTQFTVQTPSFVQWSLSQSANIEAMGSVPDAAIPGPFLVSPSQGVGITATQTTLSQAIKKGVQYKSLIVADASKFPDAPGYISVGYGVAGAVAPIAYLGRISSTEIAIDYTVKFPSDLPIGTSVELLLGKGTWTPPDGTQLGAFYLTASSAGRASASTVIDNIVAAGVTVNKLVVFPSDRGLGAEGYPAHGSVKLSGVVADYAGDDVASDLNIARNS